jgi:hypothetical protein
MTRLDVLELLREIVELARKHIDDLIAAEVVRANDNWDSYEDSYWDSYGDNR